MSLTRIDIPRGSEYIGAGLTLEFQSFDIREGSVVGNKALEKVCDYLSDARAIANSKQLPFRFLSAYRELKDLKNGRTGSVLEALEKAVRMSAINIAGYGGDTKVVIAADVSKPEAALEAAKRLYAAFAEPFLIDGREFVSSTSIGIVLSPRDGTTPNDLLKRVDVALYRAKKVARGTIRFFQPEDDSSARDRLALLRDLEMAIERDQLFLVYQPVFSLREKRVSRFEA